MQLRHALQSDIPQMMALADRSPSAAHWTHSDYARIFTSPSGGARRTALVAEDSEHTEGSEKIIIGFIVGNLIAGEDEWEIENIVVTNAHQRAGIGSKLLLELINLAKQENAQRIFLEVRESNTAAIGLYRKFGFVEAGLRKDYYSNPAENAVILSLNVPVPL